MIVTLTGAKKNVGDYLIGDRALKLLGEFVDSDIVNLNRFENLEDKLELINKSSAIILCGGPAYADNIYPEIYPLVKDLNKISKPIIPFGLGWSGRPFGEPNEFKFTEQSKELLDKVHNSIKFSSCRDVITKSILENHGYTNVIMTGCPVWYDIPSLGKPFQEKKEIKSIVFTTGAKISIFNQTLKLLKITRRAFPNAKIYLTFHRGILPIKGTSLKSGIIYTFLAVISKMYNVEIKDVSSRLDKIDFYQNCDLHIGYRVHAHLYFLSKRLPSILINEDGRGQGMVESLKLPVLNINQENILNDVEKLIDFYKSENFQSFNNTIQMIEDNFNVMRDFLSYLKDEKLAFEN